MAILKDCRKACEARWTQAPNHLDRSRNAPTDPFRYMTHTRRRDYQLALDAYAEAIGTRRMAMWNDAKGRTKGEVLAKLDEAVILIETGRVRPRAKTC